MQTPQDRDIKVGKYNTRYWAEGSQGAPVVFVHGIGGFIEDWLPSFEALAAHHRVVAVDLLGHGRTDKPKDGAYQVADLAQFVMASLPGAQKAFLKTIRANGNLFGQGKNLYDPNVQGLPSIKKPVLVIWGRQDQIVPVAHAQVAAQNIPDVRVHIFESCGHAPKLEHTQAFNQLLVEFLGNGE